MCAYCGKTMKGHTDKKRLRRGDTVTYHYYRCNRYKVRVGKKSDCKNQTLIGCRYIDEPLLLHVQHTLDRIAEIKEAFQAAVQQGAGPPNGSAVRERLAAAERRRDRLIDRVADGLITDEEARPALRRTREEIELLKGELAQTASPSEQLDLLDEFAGINLADYSLVEKRELLSIVVKEVRLRFDRMFITYNLYEAPGKLYTGRVDIDRQPAHNSKLKRK